MLDLSDLVTFHNERLSSLRRHVQSADPELKRPARILIQDGIANSPSHQVVLIFDHPRYDFPPATKKLPEVFKQICHEPSELSAIYTTRNQ